MLRVVAYTIYHSPNAYLGTILATRALAALPVEVVRRPICVPKARGLKVADLVGGHEPAARSGYHREDCLRWARRYEIPFAPPPPEAFAERAARWAASPLAREELPARAYYAALGSAHEQRLDQALFRAAWVESLDVNDEAVVKHAAAAAGLDPEALLERARGEECGRRLAEAFAAFERAECPGVPTFVVAGERYWGKDRVEMLAERVADMMRAERGGAAAPREASNGIREEGRDFAVRPFAENDADGVTALWLDVFRDDPPRNAPAAMLRELRAADPQALLVGEHRGRVVATVVAGYDGHRGWIYHLAVEPALRNQGFGREMLRAAEARLRALGCAKVNLQVRATNAQVVGFYERLGFAREDHLSMGKVLA
jgi:2-hydroxychromene-2-carboxylate isomerase/ribosomal protein S18 acetylase RimI-like enzyme